MEPMVSPKEDRKEDDSAKEEGEYVPKTEEEVGDDGKETKEEEEEVAELKTEEKVSSHGNLVPKLQSSSDPPKSFSFVDALMQSPPLQSVCQNLFVFSEIWQYI